LPLPEYKADGSEMFECRKCGALYRGTYKIGLTIKTGHFDCEVCRAHVHEWKGVREYYKWERA